MDWLEILIAVPAEDIETASAIANMVVPYGIYVEDYSDLEAGAREIAHIDLIDEELLAKDRAGAVIHIYMSDEENFHEALTYLKERYEAAKIPCRISTAGVNDKDWADNWKKFFKCTEIGEKLVIRPTWETYENTSGRVVLSIDPGAAFGTGTHATTRLCLELLETAAAPGKRMLDIGCGSGILSIAAVLLGADRAVGVDIDPLAVKVAAENAGINGISDKTVFLCGNLAGQIHGQFDVVCANIVADVIIALLPDLPRFLKPGGVFICSGIIDLREREVAGALQKNGLRITKHREQDNWHAFAAVTDD